MATINDTSRTEINVVIIGETGTGKNEIPYIKKSSYYSQVNQL